MAKQAATAEIRPIDDIRSTAKYRAAVAGNLVAEFLEQLALSDADRRHERRAGALESPFGRGGGEGNFAVLRIEGLGAATGCAKTVRG